MKKTIIFVLCSIFLFSAMACQTAEPNIEDMTAGQTAGKPNEQTTEGTHDETVADTIEKEAEEETVADTVEKETEEETVADTVEKEPEEETVADTVEKQPEEDTDREQHSGFLAYADLHEFLRAEWNRQYGKNGDAGVNSQVSIIAPILKKNDYELRNVSLEFVDTERYLDMYYSPINNPSADMEEQILVRIYVTQFMMEELIAKGFNPEKDTRKYATGWYFGLDGHCCSVRMPGSFVDDEIGVITLDQVLEYFDFEVISYSPSAETNAIQ